MKTTAVFAEIMTVGLQAMCWIALALYAFDVIELDKVNWDRLGDWSALFTMVILAIAYTAGVLVDRAADYFVRRRDRKIQNFGTVRLSVYQWGSGMVDFLEYQRSRLRVARATVVNIAMAGLFGSIASWETSLFLWVTAIGAIASLLSWLAFVAIDKSYEIRLMQAYELIKNKASDVNEKPEVEESN